MMLIDAHGALRKMSKYLVSKWLMLWYLQGLFPITWRRHHMEPLSALLAFPLINARSADLWCFFDIRMVNKRLNKQWGCWWIETPCRSCDVTVISGYPDIMIWIPLPHYCPFMGKISWTVVNLTLKVSVMWRFHHHVYRKHFWNWGWDVHV